MGIVFSYLLPFKDLQFHRICFVTEALKYIYESVDLLGFWFEIKAYEKNNHRHIVDIPRIIFFA